MRKLAIIMVATVELFCFGGRAGIIEAAGYFFTGLVDCLVHGYTPFVC